MWTLHFLSLLGSQSLVWETRLTHYLEKRESQRYIVGSASKHLGGQRWVSTYTGRLPRRQQLELHLKMDRIYFVIFFYDSMENEEKY